MEIATVNVSPVLPKEEGTMTPPCSDRIEPTPSKLHKLATFLETNSHFMETNKTYVHKCYSQHIH